MFISAMVDELTTEVENLRRDNLEGNLALLTKCRKSLHTNHSLLTEIRIRIIPIICRGPGKGTWHFPDETIELKKRLCQENLDVFKIISPGRENINEVSILPQKSKIFKKVILYSKIRKKNQVWGWIWILAEV